MSLTRQKITGTQVAIPPPTPILVPQQVGPLGVAGYTVYGLTRARDYSLRFELNLGVNRSGTTLDEKAWVTLASHNENKDHLASGVVSPLPPGAWVRIQVTRLTSIKGAWILTGPGVWDTKWYRAPVEDSILYASVRT